MSRLVRARPKAIEDLPAWAKCCKAHIDSLSPLMFGEIVISGYRPRLNRKCKCGGCGDIKPAGTDAEDTDGMFTPIEFLDLDEGEYIP